MTTTVLEEGLYDRMSEDVYHGDPVPSGSLSQSGARYLLPPYTPAHYDHYRRHPKRPSRAQELGTAAHSANLGIGIEVEVYPDPKVEDYNLKKTQQWRKEVRDAGLVPLLHREARAVRDMVAAVQQHPDAAALLTPDAGIAEASFFWIDGETGVWRRGRTDFVQGVRARNGTIEIVDGRVRVVDYKGLALDTAIPTPTGWTTMAALAEGDQVLGSDGRPCTVTGKSDVHWRTCYRLRFDDGSTVVCDDEHLWKTTTGRATNDGRYPAPAVVSTDEIRRTLRSRRGQAHHRVALAEALTLPEAALPADPYVLGYWLGDGARGQGTIAVSDADQPALLAELDRRGYSYRAWRRGEGGQVSSAAVYVHGLVQQLRPAGCLTTKAIPAAYLRASAGQRTDLLRGLMDSDGSWNAQRKQAVFTTVDKQLAEQVRELACSLGQRAVLIPYTARGFGLTRQAYHVCWRPVAGLVPFALPRKATPVAGVTAGRSARRVIVAVEEMPTVPTQCIEVDSPDRTYLCTEAFIPTHNTKGKPADRRLFAKDVWEYGYYIQGPWYAEGIQHVCDLEERPEFWWVVQETEAPYLVNCFTLDWPDEEWGRKCARAALRRYADCVANDDWPAHDRRQKPVEIPTYGHYQLRDMERDGWFFDRRYDPSLTNSGGAPVMYDDTYRGW